MIQFFEALLTVVFGFFIFSQIILPASKGRKLFPLFNKTVGLEEQLAEARQEVYEAELAKEVAAVKQSITVPEVAVPEVAVPEVPVVPKQPRKPRVKKEVQ